MRGELGTKRRVVGVMMIRPDWPWYVPRKARMSSVWVVALRSIKGSVFRVVVAGSMKPFRRGESIVGC